MLAHPNALVAVSLATLVAVAGCSSAESDELPAGPGGAGGSGGAGGAGGVAPPTCEPGSIVGPGSECMAVGIQGCAALFIDEADGLCRPTLDKCPAGTIPKLDEGCVPVGIEGCAAEFMEDDGLCHPSMAKCAADSFAAPLLGCVPIDGAEGCGAGTWGNIVDGPDTVWVDPAYAGGDGVGTQAQPLTSLAAALAVVPVGGRIALAAGSYDEPVHITSEGGAVELVGRCPSLVTISGTLSTVHGQTQWCEDCAEHDAAIVLVEGAEGVTLSGVRLSGAGYGVIALGATVTLEGLHLDQTTGAAIVARDGADVSVERCLIADTLRGPATDLGGDGLLIIGQATATVADSALFDNSHYGLWVMGRTSIGGATAGSLTATGVLVEGTSEPTTELSGSGLAVTGRGVAQLSSSALVANGSFGVLALDRAELAMDRCLSADTQPDKDGRRGSGIVVADEASGEIASCAVLANRGIGVDVAYDGAALVARGNLVRDTMDSPKKRATGLRAAFEAAGVFVDNAVVENGGLGIILQDAAAGSVIEGNLLESNGGSVASIAVATVFGGLQVNGTADAVVRANAVVGNLGYGMRLAAATAVVESNLVEDTEGADLYSAPGDGIRMVNATAELTGNAIIRSHNTGLAISKTGSAVVRRTFVAQTDPCSFDGEYGVGVLIDSVGAAELEHLVIEASHLAGLLVLGSSGTLSHARIGATSDGSFTSLACTSEYCPWNQETVHHDIADGLIAASATLTVHDLVVSGCGRAGVLFHESDGALSGASSTENGFGLVLQGAQRPEVADDCRFTNNLEQDVLEDSDLAVPNESTGLPEPTDP